MIAPWIPVTVVPTSFATVAMETFITELSNVIRNWPAASVSRTSFVPASLRRYPCRRAIAPKYARAPGAMEDVIFALLVIVAGALFCFFGYLSSR